MSTRQVKNRRGTPARQEVKPRCPTTGKYRHASKCKARKAARKTGEVRRVKLHVYQCPACFDWHLTSAAQHD